MSNKSNNYRSPVTAAAAATVAAAASGASDLAVAVGAARRRRGLPASGSMRALPRPRCSAAPAARQQARPRPPQSQPSLNQPPPLAQRGVGLRHALDASLTHPPSRHAPRSTPRSPTLAPDTSWTSISSTRGLFEFDSDASGMAVAVASAVAVHGSSLHCGWRGPDGSSLLGASLLGGFTWGPIGGSLLLGRGPGLMGAGRGAGSTIRSGSWGAGRAKVCDPTATVQPCQPCPPGPDYSPTTS